jgi:hypothetical protein
MDRHEHLRRKNAPNGPVHEQDTESLLLERLKNSQSEVITFGGCYCCWFLPWDTKVDAATALLHGFIETSSSDEQKAHCHLTLGQIQQMSSISKPPSNISRPR